MREGAEEKKSEGIFPKKKLRGPYLKYWFIKFANVCP